MLKGRREKEREGEGGKVEGDGGDMEEGEKGGRGEEKCLIWTFENIGIGKFKHSISTYHWSGITLEGGKERGEEEIKTLRYSKS